MQLVAHECSPPGLFSGHVDNVSIQRAHGEDWRHDARQHPQHHKVPVVRGEARAAQEPGLAVDVAAKPQQGQGSSHQAEQPDQDQHYPAPPDCPDAAVAEGEADLCELVDSGPGKRVDGGGLQEEEDEAAALTQGALTGVAGGAGQAVVGSKGDGGQSEGQVAEAETQGEAQRVCPELLVEEEH